jgi:hypothetical protein
MKDCFVAMPFDELYERASALFDEFRTAQQVQLAKCSKDDFSVSAAETGRRQKRC